MAMKIDPQKVKDQTLTYDEALYLKRRGRLPKGYPMPSAPKGSGDSVVEPPRPNGSTPLEEQSIPKIEDKGGIVLDDEDTEPEEYTEGWSNDQRRAELAKRGLSLDGRKDDLIARLRRSDSQTLLPEDQSTVAD